MRFNPAVQGFEVLKILSIGHDRSKKCIYDFRQLHDFHRFPEFLHNFEEFYITYVM